MVDLYFDGSNVKKLNLKADSVISFCLQSKAKFYCSISMIKKSKELTTEQHQMSMSMDSAPYVRPAGGNFYLN